MSDEKFCGASITQYKDTTHNCPSVIKFSDLTATCDNPIETQWQFKKMYGITETHEDVICENQDVCDIFTSYEVSFVILQETLYRYIFWRQSINETLFITFFL